MSLLVCPPSSVWILVHFREIDYNNTGLLSQKGVLLKVLKLIEAISGNNRCIKIMVSSKIETIFHLNMNGEFSRTQCVFFFNWKVYLIQPF